MATSVSRRPVSTAGLVVIWVVTVGLASGLPASLAVVAGWSAGPIVLPPLVVALLVVAAGSDVARAVRPLLFVLAASVTGLWVITIGLGAAQRVLAGWPLAVQILVVNGAKVVPLALTAAVLLRYRPSREDSALRVRQWWADSGLRVAPGRVALDRRDRRGRGLRRDYCQRCGCVQRRWAEGRPRVAARLRCRSGDQFGG